MNTQSLSTEAVVRNHLHAFLEQKGIAAILNDHDEKARFYSEARIYQGKEEIRGFFNAFLDSLPAGATSHFSLGTLQVDGDIAYITWSVGVDIPMGTDILGKSRKDRFADVCDVRGACSVDSICECARRCGQRPTYCFIPLSH